MNITLDEAGYKSFLVEFRQADQANAARRGETRVDFVHKDKSATYYYKAPNFECIAYSLNGGPRINLTKYTHPNELFPASQRQFVEALLAGGNGGTVVEGNLSKVITLTSEAARSALVERNIIKAINDGMAFDCADHKFLFNAYGKTTDHLRFGGVGGGYQAAWEPLDKWHYASYFQSTHTRLRPKETRENRVQPDAVRHLLEL